MKKEVKNMSKTLGHAIIGCGRIAQNHYNAAKENGFAVLWCCDLDKNKARRFAEKNNIRNYTDNYLDILNSQNIDTVSICTDHKSHTEIAEKFLNKKHIIIEKPLSVNLQSAKEFVNKAINSKKITIIAQHRFDNVVNLVKLLLKDDSLGNITLVNANLICHRDTDYYKESYWRGTLDKEGGSTIINQSFHMVDTLVYLFGIPEQVKTFKKNLRFQDIINTEDTCTSILDYGNFLCTLSSTNTAIEEWSTSIQIVGTNGNITFNIDFPEEITKINISEKLKSKYSRRLKEIQENYEKNLSIPANYYGLSHIKQFADFKNSILNKSEVKVGLKEALETQMVIDMIYKG